MQFFSPLMGVNFRGAEIRQLVTDLQVGQKLGLERDPNNEYDPNAIKVIFFGDDEDQFIGFIAKEVAEELAPLLDNGFEASATIIDFLGPIKPHLEIEASFADEEDENESDEEDESADEAAPASAD